MKLIGLVIAYDQSAFSYNYDKSLNLNEKKLPVWYKMYAKCSIIIILL